MAAFRRPLRPPVRLVAGAKHFPSRLAEKDPLRQGGWRLSKLAAKRISKSVPIGPEFICSWPSCTGSC
jgi:hypothetical protein